MKQVQIKTIKRLFLEIKSSKYNDNIQKEDYSHCISSGLYLHFQSTGVFWFVKATKEWQHIVE